MFSSEKCEIERQDEKKKKTEDGKRGDVESHTQKMYYTRQPDT